MVNINIDGKSIEVPEGTTVLRAAQNAGIHIPTLCDHPHLTPYGGCRMCLVDVEGSRTLQPSCTLPASNNMVVKTATKKVLDARKFVLTLIFSERNHFCPYCQVSGGDCELQNTAYGEGMTHWPLQPNWSPFPVDASHPYIIMESNRCILCRRCVRACGDLVGNYTLGFEERGAKSMLVADTGIPLGQSTCISCGACVQVCPTGALIDRWSAYRGHETDIEVTKTVCVGCSVGCEIEVLTRDNNLVRINGNWDAKMNEGVICELGRFDPLKDKCDRIVTPLVRADGALKAATWEDALAAIAAQFKPLAGKSTDGLAAMISTRQPVETLTSFKKLFETSLGASLVTSTEEGEYTSNISTLADSVGESFEGSLFDLQQSDGVLVFSTDLVKDHQVAGFFIKRMLNKGMNLLVVDNNTNGLDAFANKALKPTKAADDAVIKGIMSAIVKLGLAKHESTIKATDLEMYASKSGLTTDDFLDAAYVIGSAEKPVIVCGNNEFTTSLKSLAELIDANLLSIKGDANSLAASQLGLENKWKSNGFKAAYIALGDAEASQKLIKEFEKIPFKVVQATYASALTGAANVVLPSTNWLEEEGHFISLDGHIQFAKQSLVPPEGILSIQETLTKLSETLNYKIEGDWTKEMHKRISPVEITK